MLQSIAINLIRPLQVMLFSVLLCVCAGCGTASLEATAANAEATAETTPALTTTQSTQVNLQPTALPVIEPTAVVSARLAIWWPDVLSSAGSEEASTLLAEQLRLFEINESNVTIDFRIKRVGDVGGILSTLRSASSVAPGALPDITLIRREDLPTAARAGLIQPLEGRIPTAILGDFYDPVLQMGLVDGQLYGLPYALTVQHIVYTGAATPALDVRFDALLAGELPFLFPAGRAIGVNSTFLAQYYAAGGTPLSAENVVINAEALLAVFHFYEQAVARGIMTSAVLDYTSPEDYRPLLLEETPGVSVASSSLYLDLRKQGLDYDFGALPTVDGNSVTMATGWVWVMVTSDITRQTLALRFIEWMMATERQAQYVESVNLLPSQRTAFLFWSDQAYAEFVDLLLNNAYLPLSEESSSIVARILQNALVAVINQTRTAEEAVEDVLAQLEPQ